MLCIVILSESRCIAHVRVEKAAFPSKKETESLFIPDVKKMLGFTMTLLIVYIILVMHIHF